PVAGSFVLAPDEGRLGGHGRGLHGVLITWPIEAGRASDSCRNLEVGGGAETCTWGVPKTLSADPSASSLRGLPSGARAPDAPAPRGRDGRRLRAGHLPDRLGDASLAISARVGGLGGREVP